MPLPGGYIAAKLIYAHISTLQRNAELARLLEDDGKEFDAQFVEKVKRFFERVLS